MKKRKIRYDNVTTIVIVGIIFLLIITKVLSSTVLKNNDILMKDFTNKKSEEVNAFFEKNNIDVKKEYKYNFDIPEGYVINQNIKKDTKLNKKSEIIITISKGPVPFSIYEENQVNELGHIPVMMYHGIENILNKDTKYTGGNIDKNGYIRTAEAFRKDLDTFYKNNYRMIRLEDYVNGKINVELGKSPIVLTFDDGKINNFKVLGLDSNQELILDPNSAVGILEEYKNKYPDFNVTATFFLNDWLFTQPKYNEKIIKWLIKNGYDIGNHTKDHKNFTKMNETESEYQVGYMYDKLNTIIPGKFVNIVALPFGAPYSKNHENFDNIMKGNFNNTEYNTLSTLRVGWGYEFSPFKKDFDKTFIRRNRAWDNNGKEFDIEMLLKILKDTKYISDGNDKTIVYKKIYSNKINKDINLKQIEY